MVIQRAPRNLPGTDTFLLPKTLAVIFLCMVVFMLAIDMVTAAVIGGRGGHLPWPVAQWALTTPLGSLTVSVVGALAWGLPVALAVLTRPFVVLPVDVTELPPIWWPRPLPPWRTPGGGTLADYLLGRGRSQRAWSVLTLVLAALLVIGLFAAYISATWYGLRHIPDCSGPSCPPNFSAQFSPEWEVIGMSMWILSLVARKAYVERRCGIWFRSRENLDFRLGSYIRRPGVTREAAAAALQRYVWVVRGPVARGALLIALALTPAMLLMIGGELLSAWLSSQWIPA